MAKSLIIYLIQNQTNKRSEFPKNPNNFKWNTINIVIGELEM